MSQKGPIAGTVPEPSPACGLEAGDEAGISARQRAEIALAVAERDLAVVRRDCEVDLLDATNRVNYLSEQLNAAIRAECAALEAQLAEQRADVAALTERIGRARTFATAAQITTALKPGTGEA